MELETKWSVWLARSRKNLMEAGTGVTMSGMGKVGGYQQFVLEVESAGLCDGRWSLRERRKPGSHKPRQVQSACSFLITAWW